MTSTIFYRINFRILCAYLILISIGNHTEILSGKRPPSYLVYTTGRGFMPHIESVPHAMKGIGTVFMMALLTGKIVPLQREAHYTTCMPWPDGKCIENISNNSPVYNTS